MPAKGKTQQWPQDWKRSLFFPIPKKGNAKEFSNYHTVAHASKVMLKIPHTGLQQYMNQELPDVQARFRKGRDQIASICWIIEKAREFQKNIWFLDYVKAIVDGYKPLCGSQQTGKFLRERNTRPPYLPSEKPVCGSRNKLEPNMEQWIGSKLGKKYI